MRKSIIVTAALVLTLALTACGKKEADSKTLVMATNAQFPPYEYLDDNGDFAGIDVEIAQAIADNLGKELEIRDMEFDSIITDIQSGKADIGLAGMTITEDRLENVNFSDSYTTAAQVIIVTEGSTIAGPDDLTGKKIGVQLGTTGDIYSEDIEGATIDRFSKGMEAVQSLTQGKVDAVIIDREPAKVFVSENQGLKMVDQEFTLEDYAIAISKDNEELLTQINESLKELKDSGKLQEIIDKYISADK